MVHSNALLGLLLKASCFPLFDNHRPLSLVSCLPPHPSDLLSGHSMLPTTIAQPAGNVDGPRSPPFLFPGFVVYPGMPSLSFYLHAKQFGLPALPTGIPIMGLPWSTSMPPRANASPTKSHIFELAEKRIGELMVKLRSAETRGETLLQLAKYKDNAHLSSIIWSTFGTRLKVVGKYSLLIVLTYS